MEKILNGIKGERFPFIKNNNEPEKYSIRFRENADITSVKEDEILWQLHWANEDSKYEKVPFSGQKKGKEITITFKQALLGKNLQLIATYKEETAQIHIVPQSNGEEKIIDVFFLDVEYKEQNKDNLKYMMSLNLQIYTLNMLGKNVDFKIYDIVNDEEKEVYNSPVSLEILQKNGVVKTKQAIMFTPFMPMQTQKDMSASEHNYKIKVWQTDNESNFYEEELKVKNEMGQMTVPQDSQVPIKTGTSEPVKKKEEEKKEKQTCGIQYRNSITCVRYGKQYGPLYSGSVSITSFKGWGKLLSDGKLSKEEKDIICGMSVNEGNLDAVQSYDSELITMGAMQKTTKTTGNGELSTQIGEFKEEFKEKYKELFENCGWDFKKENNKWKAYYKSITGDTLKDKIRSGFYEKNNKKKVVCIPLEPLINAGKDEDFQTKQINDFIDRLRNCLDEKPVKKYHKNKDGLRIADDVYDFKAKDIMKSKLGRALVLDQSVNRPSLTRFNLGEAINRFFINNPKVSKAPSDWKEHHFKYETEIILDYGKKREGTDMLLRYNKINNNPIVK